MDWRISGQVQGQGHTYNADDKRSLSHAVAWMRKMLDNTLQSNTYTKQACNNGVLESFTKVSKVNCKNV